MAAPSCNFDIVPDHMLLKILKYLSAQDLYAMSRTCQRFCFLCFDGSIISYLKFGTFHTMTEKIFKEIILHSFHKLKRLDLNNCYWLRGSVVMEMVTKCKNLVHLHLIECSLTEVQICKILGGLPKLLFLSCSIKSIMTVSEELVRRVSAQRTMVNLRTLCLHFKQDSRTLQDFNICVNFVQKPSLFHYCANLESLRVVGTPHRGMPKCMLRPMILNLDNFKQIKELSINDAVDPAARIFFFGALLELCKIDLHLKTLLKPTANLNKPNFANCFKHLNEMENLDLSRSNIEFPDSVINWELAENLQHLNLTENIKINSVQLKYLAQVCPNLLSLSLQNCLLAFQIREENVRIREDLSGLHAVVISCRNLRHLNLSGIHAHDLSRMPATVCDLLTYLPDLESLSLSPCAAAKFEFVMADEDLKKLKGYQTLLPSAGKRRRIGIETKRVDESPSTSAEVAASWKLHDLEKLVRGCPRMKQFELISSNFRSACHKFLGIHLREEEFFPCEFSKYLQEHHLASIGKWQYLRYLQLTGIPGIHNGQCLIAIAKGCVHLEVLYVAQLGLSGHCTYSYNLCVALTYCTKLRDFRLEQPFIILNEMFFSSFHNCKQLQRVCIAARGSTFQPSHVEKLFERVPTLVVLQLFARNTISKCKELEAYLIKKYKPSRAALWITVFPIHHERLKEEVNSMPTKHYDELTLLGSIVCLKPPGW